eukprot:31447-Pelagococcus_subviridis.AAC.11
MAPSFSSTARFATRYSSSHSTGARKSHFASAADTNTNGGDLFDVLRDGVGGVKRGFARDVVVRRPRRRHGAAPRRVRVQVRREEHPDRVHAPDEAALREDVAHRGRERDVADAPVHASVERRGWTARGRGRRAAPGDGDDGVPALERALDDVPAHEPGSAEDEEFVSVVGRRLGGGGGGGRGARGDPSQITLNVPDDATTVEAPGDARAGRSRARRRRGRARRHHRRGASGRATRAWTTRRGCDARRREAAAAFF